MALANCDSRDQSMCVCSLQKQAKQCWKALCPDVTLTLILNSQIFVRQVSKRGILQAPFYLLESQFADDKSSKISNHGAL